MLISQIPKNDKEVLFFNISVVAGVKFLDIKTFVKEKDGNLTPIGKDASVILNLLPTLINDFKARAKDTQETVAALEKVMKSLEQNEVSEPQQGGLLKEFVKEAFL